MVLLLLLLLQCWLRLMLTLPTSRGCRWPPVMRWQAAMMSFSTLRKGQRMYIERQCKVLWGKAMLLD